MSDNIEIKFLNESSTILFSGGLLIENVSVAHNKLLNLINSLECNDITLCFKELKYCDIVGIQLILSMIKSLIYKRINFNIINLNKSITDSINRHGLGDSDIFNLQ